MNRRDLVKNLAILNCGSALLASNYLKAAPSSSKSNTERDFFEELGVRKVINASVTMTFLSGSLMRPEVLQAINTTSHAFANMYELQDKAGGKIAEMLHCEAAMVTSGAACGLLLGTAACITGKDSKKSDHSLLLTDRREKSSYKNPIVIHLIRLWQQPVSSSSR